MSKMGKNNNQINELKAMIAEDTRKMQQVKSRTSEFIFNTVNNEGTINHKLDLHGLSRQQAINTTKLRVSITQDGLNNGAAGNLVSAKVAEHKVSNQKKQTSVTDFFRKLPTRKSL